MRMSHHREAECFGQTRDARSPQHPGEQQSNTHVEEIEASQAHTKKWLELYLISEVYSASYDSVAIGRDGCLNGFKVNKNFEYNNRIPTAT